jgi:hypothetical protein
MLLRSGYVNPEKATNIGVRAEMITFAISRPRPIALLGSGGFAILKTNQQANVADPADFNGDGIPELAISDANSGQILLVD